jgi:pimeloyl-ACP methyl ester carboxylesterase
LLALGAALALSHGAAAQTPAPGTDPGLAAYAEPGTLVTLDDGRRMHVRCVGSGQPAVVLLAGLADWSISWRKVQPALSALTQTCTWDRAGFGYSEGSRLPQTMAQLTQDLRAALTLAGVRGPYVLVGHSAGGLEAVSFHDRHPDEVAGLVLVDPSVPGQADILAQAAPATSAVFQRQTAGQVQKGRDCHRAALAGQLLPGQPDAGGCLRLLVPPTGPRAMVSLLEQLDADPLRWAARISLVEGFAGQTLAMRRASRQWGDLPTVVLGATRRPRLPPDAPAEVAAQWPAFFDAFGEQHRLLARLSTQGVHRLVPDAGHAIQSDQPAAVIEAVTEVVTGWRRLTDTAAAASSRPPGGR